MSEHRGNLISPFDRRLSCIRYVDDNFSQTIVNGTSQSFVTAQNLLGFLNNNYPPPLVVKPEPSFHRMAIFLGVILIQANRGDSIHLGMMILNKNFLYGVIAGLSPFQQIWRSEHHFDSYQPRSVLMGQRYGRFCSVLALTDPEFHYLALLMKCYENIVMLGDPVSFCITALRKLFTTHGTWAIKLVIKSLRTLPR